MSGVLRSFHEALSPYPPRRFTIADYKRWFPKTGSVFLRELKRSSVFPIDGPQSGPTIGLVVMPWVSTAPPWYAIMLAVGFMLRGRRVILLWDDTGFPEQFLQEQNDVIHQVLSYVGQHIDVVRLSEQEPADSRETDAEVIEALTAQNVCWALRGVSPTEHDRAFVADVRASLQHSLPYVRAAVQRENLDFLVVCGGVYGTTGLFRLAGSEVGCRVATYDADIGVAQICVDGIASQCQDIPRAFEELLARSDDERRDAISVALVEFERRAELRDRYGFQAVPAGRAESWSEGCVLIPLNVEWDTSALGNHLHFENSVDWVTSAIDVILETDPGPVVVRQHPSERRQFQASRLDIASILLDRYGDDPRVRFVAADDPVSTYDLLESARIVLPYVSTIGIEAAGLDKVVLVAGSSYYADLGFVWRAASQDEYFALLRQGLRGELGRRPDQYEHAWLCYYLTAVRNRIWTDFTPQPGDFWRWCRRSPRDLFADPDVADMLDAIERDVPVSLLRHDRATCPTIT